MGSGWIGAPWWWWVGTLLVALLLFTVAYCVGSVLSEGNTDDDNPNVVPEGFDGVGLMEDE